MSKAKKSGKSAPESKPAKVTGRCGDTCAGIKCRLPKRHPGDHAGDGGTWSRDRSRGHFDCGVPLLRVSSSHVCGAALVGTGKCQLNADHGGDHLLVDKLHVYTWTKSGERNDWRMCGAAKDGHRCMRPDEHDNEHMALTATKNDKREIIDVAWWPDGGAVTVIHASQPAQCLHDALDDEPKQADDADEMFTADNADRWWWGYRGRLGHVHVKQYTGDMAPVLDARAHPIVGRNVIGPFMVGPGETYEHAEREVKSRLERIAGSPAGHSPTSVASSRTGLAGAFRRTKQSSTSKKKAVPAMSALPAPAKGQRKDKAATNSAPASELKPGISILGYRRHPIAAKWPMLKPDELAALAFDIKTNGQLRPIVLLEEGGETFILDGSNRGAACELAGVKPKFENYKGARDLASLKAYVQSCNRHRRHLAPSVIALIAGEEDSKDAQILPKGHRQVGKFAEVPTARQRAERRDISVRMLQHGQAVHKKADPLVKDAVLAGRLKIDSAALLAELPPADQRDFVKQVTAKGNGEVKVGHVRALIRQRERRNVVAKINTDRVKSVTTLAGPFGVALWDPPWRYDNSDDHAGARGHTKYPTMTVEDIIAYGRTVLTRMKEDAIHFIWLTNAFVPSAVRVVAELGLTWVTMGTWTKNKVGMGQYMRGRTEHFAVAISGKPIHTLNEVSTWLGDRPLDVGAHSEKPIELHEVIEKHCAGPYLELFGRRERDQWEVLGAEVGKFAAANAA